ncbi:MAG: lysophospholipid acyltransferase family protein [Planctomycetaceae bacterium]|nr:lysophospholipid acyltransferase family protein [Planctomycetaceae bacterium]
MASCTLRINQMWGRVIGRILCRYNSESRQVALRNLEIAYPTASPEKLQQLLREHMLEVGKTIAEFGPVWLWSRRRLSQLVRETDGEELLAEAVSRGNGVIILSPHLGCWEFVGLYLSMNHPMTSMYRPPRLVALDNMMRSLRQRFGAKLVPADLSGVAGLRRALKNNEYVGMLPDQHPGANGGVEVPFFGYTTRTMVLVSKLAARSGATVIFSVAERLPDGRGFRLRFRLASDLIAASDDTVAARALNEGVEECIRWCPSQYQWSYDRFRLRQTLRNSDSPTAPEQRAA